MTDTDKLHFFFHVNSNTNVYIKFLCVKVKNGNTYNIFLVIIGLTHISPTHLVYLPLKYLNFNFLCAIIKGAKTGPT